MMDLHIRVEQNPQGNWAAWFVESPLTGCIRGSPKEAIIGLAEITNGWNIDLRTIVATEPDSSTQLNFTISCDARIERNPQEQLAQLAVMARPRVADGAQEDRRELRREVNRP
jgi:hypothetical protein